MRWNFLIILVFILGVYKSQVRAQAVQWAVNSYSSEVTGLCGGLDINYSPDGSLIISGVVNGEVQFGDSLIPDIGMQQMVISSWTDSGQLKWVRTMPLIGGFAALPSLDVYPSGDIILQFQFTDTLVIGTDTLKSLPLLYSQALVRLDANGQFSWAHKLMSDGPGIYNVSVSAYQHDSLYVMMTGSGIVEYQDSVLPDSGILNFPHLWLLSLDANGDLRWTRQSRSGVFYGHDIAQDLEGNLYIAGTYIDSLSYGGDSLFAITDHWESCIISTDKMGNSRWMQTGGDEAIGLSFDSIHMTLHSIHSYNLYPDFPDYPDSLYPSFAGTFPTEFGNQDFCVASWQSDGSFIGLSAYGSFFDDDVEEIASHNGYILTGFETNPNFIHYGDTLNPAFKDPEGLIITGPGGQVLQPLFFGDSIRNCVISGICMGNSADAYVLLNYSTHVQAGPFHLSSPGSGFALVRIDLTATARPEPQADHIRLYPNPSEGVFNLELPASTGGPAAFEVYDLAGRVLHHGTCETGRVNRIETSLPAGLYLIRVRMPDGNSLSHRILIH